jgi:hypothetical protein
VDTPLHLERPIPEPNGALKPQLKGGNTLSNLRELVIAAVNVTLPDASASIPHLPQRSLLPSALGVTLRWRISSSDTNSRSPSAPTPHPD